MGSETISERLKQAKNGNLTPKTTGKLIEYKI